MTTPKWADLLRNNKFIYTNAVTGRFGAWSDHDAYGQFLDVDVDDQTLGASLKKALLASRYITDDEELLRFYKQEQPKRHKQWIEETMREYGYTNEDKFLNSFIEPSIDCKNGVVTFKPTYNTGHGGSTGDGVPESDNIHIPFDASDEELGAAARLALSRCK